MKLSQTLDGDWQITVTNPEEPGWETRLADFDMSAVGEGSPAQAALEDAAAAALASFARKFSAVRFTICGNTPEVTQRMRQRFVEISLALGVAPEALASKEAA